MTYKEWFYFVYKEEWTVNHEALTEYIIEYEEFCDMNDITPVWDGE